MIEIEGGVKGGVEMGVKGDDSLYATFSYGQESPWRMSMKESVRLLPSVDDALEVGTLERSASDETSVDVGLSEEFRRVGSLARTAIEDRRVVGNLLTILLLDDRTDVSMDFLSLVACSRLTSSDGPDRLVSDDDFLEVLSREIEYRAC